MKQLKKIQAALLLGLLTGGAAVQAADMNINGVVVSSPCTVDAGFVSQYVDFGQTVKNVLSDAGSSGDWRSFEIRLKNCPSTVDKVTASFSGTPATEDASLYSNSGTATNVAVQVATQANKSLIKGPGETMVADVDTERNAVFDLAARLYSVSGGVTVGTVDSVAQVNFTYQ